MKNKKSVEKAIGKAAAIEFFRFVELCEKVPKIERLKIPRIKEKKNIGDNATTERFNNFSKIKG